MTAATVTILPTRLRRPRTEDNRGAHLSRAYALLAALIGREWVTRQELDTAIGCHRRTTLRWISAAQGEGLIEVRRGKTTGDDPTQVRLVDRRLRR